MSIDSKHAYRFEYLKSDKWQSVRLEALVRENAKCQICGEESIHNDAHHMWYPESIYDTTPNHLIVLCRPCHNFLHIMVPECKTNDPAIGQASWNKFRDAIVSWRLQKSVLFDQSYEGGALGPKQLRDAYFSLRKRFEAQGQTLEAHGLKADSLKEVRPKGLPQSDRLEDQIRWVVSIVKKWGRAYEEKESIDNDSNGELSVEQPDSSAPVAKALPE